MTVVDVSPLEEANATGRVVYEMLSDEEACLYAILTDASGLDLAEFTWSDERNDDGCWRAYPFQWAWWRDRSPQQVDQGARSIGKSESIMARVCIFPFVHPGGEMVITAPEAVHVDAITDRIESRLTGTRLMAEMLLGGRFGVNHRPFKAKFRNGAMVHSRLPQKSGIGVKGCVGPGTLVLTRRGQVPVEDVVVGDEVLTHRNRWRPVTHVWRFDVDETRVINGQGHSGLVTSDVHRFYVRENEAGPKARRKFGAPGWKVVDDCADAYWGSPAEFPDEPEPTWPFRPAFQLLFVAGAFLANGHIDYGRNDDGERIRFRSHFVVRADKAPDIVAALVALGLNPSVKPHRDTGANRVEVSSRSLALWLEQHCGRGSHHKHLPTFALGLRTELRSALIEGYLHGDGYFEPNRKRWEVSSASKALAVGVKLLGQSLGWAAALSTFQPKVSQIAGVDLKQAPALSYRVQLREPSRRAVLELGSQWAKVSAVEPGPAGVVYDLTVAEDHSYVSDGIYSHNTHPVWLELDEGQDYPARGWKEIVETVNWSVEGAQWRVHGVSKGVRDRFYEMTQDDSDWKVHHITAIHRPTWDEEEREAKIAQYGGSIHDPDFRRNVYGVHGDQANNIFVLSRFMAGVDTNEGSHYNLEEYFMRRITAEMVDDQVHGRASGTIDESSDEHVRALVQMLDFPELHKRYEVFWVGMDVGITRDPSEILVFAEYQPATTERNEQRKAGLAVPLDGATRLKLVTRLSLLRLPTPLQAEVIMHLIDFYRPRAFSMDRTGNGLPLFMDLQRRALESRLVVVDTDEFDDDVDEATRAQIRTMRAKAASRASDAKAALTTIKGYPFDASVVVEIDEERAAALPGTPSPQEIAEKAGIKRRVKDYATDTLRDLVDRQRLLLPYDVELINQWNAQTWSYQASPVDAYGRRRMAFSSGTFHTLDAGRMASLGMFQQPIEALLAAPAPKQKPVLPRFIG